MFDSMQCLSEKCSNLNDKNDVWIALIFTLLYLTIAHLFGQEVCADGGLVLVGELLVDVLVHQRRLAHARVAEDDHLC